jgi:D-amino peptidase
VNGRPVGEIGLNALLAGHFGVPVALVTGDQAAVEEARALLGQVEGAVVKRGVDRYAARLVHPSRAVELVRVAARRALEDLPEMRPFSLGLPARLEVDLADTAMAERVCLLPAVERQSPRGVAFHCEDTLRLMKDLMLATVLARSVMDPLY